ncbi:hypothetical protein HERIO_637 [Hepatospora eriocheir]|uniref:Uncharacterized protein n=1 Tax=Hepatospora eriocheir TaxID=1081669 RepID=A0A1X0QCH2_9MICR|nr:hypothetical protein HERIO_637 [Hepatospora eriocheir]
MMDFIKDNNFQIDEYISNNSFIKKYIYSCYSLRLSLCKFFIKGFSNNHVFSYYFDLFNNCCKLGCMIKKIILDSSNLDLCDSYLIDIFLKVLCLIYNEERLLNKEFTFYNPWIDINKKLKQFFNERYEQIDAEKTKQFNN